MSVKQDAVNPSSPIAATAAVETLLEPTQCAASGAYTGAGIIETKEARRMTLYLDYNPAAVGGTPGILPLGTGESEQPAADADSWYAFGGTDGTVTAAVLGGAVPSGADYSAAPSYNHATFRGLLVKLDPADDPADELRVAVTLDVTSYTYVQLAYAEDGATGSPGTLGVKYSLSA